ncbi:MAG TPA: beta-ribofuranosylaminobenzene 5'-phosphate synthase family protein [Burkholderiales bacterium]|nr:beta-ribofuranosylaminobenzene 5'-phosphate synthase family protein [Burkholderiales bacterium]
MTGELSPTSDRVLVEAPGRLHLGFLDLHGGLGRTFGSVGLTLEGVATVVAAQHASADSVSGPEGERALDCLVRVKEALRLRGGVALAVERAIPGHAGLGSGTQLALAVGTAVTRLYGVELPARETASLLDRGARSGIGIGAFEQGGFLVDGGRGRRDAPPPLVSRLPFPAAWRAVLVFDTVRQGLHGTAEVGAFRALPQFPEAAAARLCRLTLMQALPALVEEDLPRFGAAIGELQRVVGDHFAPAQGGRFASPAVAEALALFQSAGAACIGQSSWGPTGFALADSRETAEALVRLARGRLPSGLGLDYMVCAGRNQGAEVRVEAAQRRRRVTH